MPQPASKDMTDHLDYLDLSALSWKRPPKSPFRVWRTVKGRKSTEAGRTLKFSIQEIPEDRYEDVLDFMCKYFLNEEVTISSLKISEDSLAVQEFRTIWRSLLRQGICLVALTDNPEGGKPLIAGVNMLYVITPKDKVFFHSLKVKAQSLGTLMSFMQSWSDEVNVFEKYGVQICMSGLGLFVHPSMRGQGLGESILRARDDIGREFHIPVAETMFSGVAAQIVAERVGYKVLKEQKFSEIFNERGELMFPGVTVEYLKETAKKLY